MEDNNSKTIPDILLRRRDRSISSEAWIERMLETAPYAIAGVNGDEYPHLHMNTFYFDKDERAIYMHTAREGATRMRVGTGAKVTFTISSMGRLLPARTATQMSVEYRSVMIHGRISIVEDQELSRDKMSKFVQKYFAHLMAGTDYEPISAEEIADITVYRITIDSWIGKRKRERDDFPGAFMFGRNTAR